MDVPSGSARIAPPPVPDDPIPPEVLEVLALPPTHPSFGHARPSSRSTYEPSLIKTVRRMRPEEVFNDIDDDVIERPAHDIADDDYNQYVEQPNVVDYVKFPTVTELEEGQGS